EAVKCRHCGEWLDERALDRIEGRGVTVRVEQRRGAGSGGNVLAALSSLFIPGLGQLIQGRVTAALGWFIGVPLVWFLALGTGFMCLVGPAVSLWCVVDAARWQ